MSHKKWRDLSPGYEIRIKGVTWFVEAIKGGKYHLINKDGETTIGAPRDLDRMVEIISEPDPLVSALSEVASVPPMDAARAAVRVVLGGVELGEEAPGGSWLCPAEEGSDAVTLAVHRLMFHQEQGITHSHRN